MNLSHEFVEDIEEILSSSIVDLKRLSKFAQFGYPESSSSFINLRISLHNLEIIANLLASQTR